MVCPKCNVSLPDGTTYCNNCNTQIAVPPLQPDYSQQPPPQGYAPPPPATDYSQQPGYAPAGAQPGGYPQQGYQQPYAPHGGASSGLPGGLSKNAIIGIGAGVGALFLIIVIVLIVSFASSGPKIVGEWEFVTGQRTYFFWRSEYIEFKKDGTVHNYDDNESGTWELDGDFLTVYVRPGRSEYYFTVSLEGDRLRITDEDNDTGTFRRIK